MNDRALKALEGSIANWQGIVDGRERGVCSLCSEFNKKFSKPSEMCLGCPVMEKTGHPRCEGTPIDRWLEMETHDFPYSSDQIEIARQELSFLKSLLPGQ